MYTLKYLAAFSLIGAILLGACNKSSNTNTTAVHNTQNPLTLKLGYENAVGDPFDQGCRKWKELVEKESNGAIIIELYPNSTLGSKKDIMDRMMNNENVATLTDGAFLADYGAKDLGIIFAPYLFYSWEQAFRLNGSQWFLKERNKLAQNTNIYLLSSNWRYGRRHILSTEPLQEIDDFQNIVMRVPNNKIQEISFNLLGAKTVRMPLEQVNQALKDGTINAVENPLPVIYYSKLYENAKYLLLDSHIYNVTNISIPYKFFNSLTKEQQTILKNTCDEAGDYQNSLREKLDEKLLAMLKEEGVKVSLPSPELKKDLINLSSVIFTIPEYSHWKTLLKDNVEESMY